MYLELNEASTELTIADGDNLSDCDTQRVKLDVCEVEDLIVQLIDYIQRMKIDSKKVRISELHRQKDAIELELRSLGE